MKDLTLKPHPVYNDKVVVEVSMEIPEVGRITASKSVDRADLIQLVSSEAESRQLAVYLVGRMITAWKLDLITALTGAVGEGAARYIAQQSSQRRSSTTPPEDGG